MKLLSVQVPSSCLDRALDSVARASVQVPGSLHRSELDRFGIVRSQDGVVQHPEALRAMAAVEVDLDGHVGALFVDAWWRPAVAGFHRRDVVVV